MDVEVTVSSEIKDREEVGAKFGYMEDLSELYWISFPPAILGLSTTESTPAE